MLTQNGVIRICQLSRIFKNQLLAAYRRIFNYSLLSQLPQLDIAALVVGNIRA